MVMATNGEERRSGVGRFGLFAESGVAAAGREMSDRLVSAVLLEILSQRRIRIFFNELIYESAP